MVDQKARCQALARQRGLSPEVITAAWQDDHTTRGRRTPEVEAVLRALFEAGVTGKDMGRALNIHASWQLLQMGLSTKTRSGLVDLPGEKWRRVPGFRAMVSNMGRAKSHHDRILTPIWYANNYRVDLYAVGEKRKSVGRGPRKTRLTLSRCIAAAFRLTESPADYVRHRDGDRRNCRLENLQVPRRSASGQCKELTRVDIPWTAQDDTSLRQAQSLGEAVRKSRHLAIFTRARIKQLGIQYPERAKQVTPLDERDLGALKACVEELERGMVSDRAINLALRIDGKLRRSPEVTTSVEECLTHLIEANWSRHRIAAAFGWSDSYISQWMIRAGYSDGWRGPSKLGLPEAVDGEIWRPLGWGYQISSKGRVLGRRGGLLSVRLRDGDTPIVTLNGPAGYSTFRVARLVLAMFKPDLPYSHRVGRLDGDPANVAADNLVPAEIASNAEGHLERLWAEAKKACPNWIQEPAIRNDLASDAMMLMAEGAENDARAAMKAAIKRYNDLTGNDLSPYGRRGQSMDQAIPGTDGLTLGDTFSSEIDRI